MADRPALSPDAEFEDVSRENIADAFNEVDELLERWDERLAIDNLALAERYLKNEIVFVFTWTDRSTGVAKKYLTVFERVNPTGRFDRKWRKLRDRPSTIGGNKIGEYSRNVDGPQNLGISGPDGDEQNVFIEDIELEETPEGVCPSLVWLEPFDDAPRASGNVVEVLRDPPIEEILAGTYWEVGFIQSAFAGAPIFDGEVNGQKIEGGSKIVDEVTNQARPRERHLLLNAKLEYLCSRLRVFIDNDEVRISFLKGFNSSIQLVKVLLGPVDLYPDALKVSHAQTTQR